jgi:hypothetical protein
MRPYLEKKAITKKADEVAQAVKLGTCLANTRPCVHPSWEAEIRRIKVCGQPGK